MHMGMTKFLGVFFFVFVFFLRFQTFKPESTENKSKPNCKNQTKTFCWILIWNDYAHVIPGGSH